MESKNDTRYEVEIRHIINGEDEYNRICDSIENSFPYTLKLSQPEIVEDRTFYFNEKKLRVRGFEGYLGLCVKKPVIPVFLPYVVRPEVEFFIDSAWCSLVSSMYKFIESLSGRVTDESSWLRRKRSYVNIFGEQCIKICIDTFETVSDGFVLGRFVEIESIAKSNEGIELAIAEIKKAAELLGLSDNTIHKESYSDVIKKWKSDLS